MREKGGFILVKWEGGEETDGRRGRGDGRRDGGLIPKCSHLIHLIQTVNLCTLIKQELHTLIIPIIGCHHQWSISIL